MRYTIEQLEHFRRRKKKILICKPFLKMEDSPKQQYLLKLEIDCGKAYR